MEWVLYVCTAGWVMCGQIREVVYPSEATCYRALDELYRRNKPDTFKYVICEPKALNKTANALLSRKAAGSGDMNETT